MCEQCLVEILSIRLPEGKVGPIYLGIARKDIEWRGYERGDLLIGRCNDPDFRYSGDLFTTSDFLAYAENDYDEDGGPIDFFYEEGEAYLFKNLAEFPGSAATAATVFCQVFPLVELDGVHRFGLHLVTALGDLFTELGIPLTKTERANWATQFPSAISGVERREDSYALHYYFVTSKEPYDGEWRTLPWTEGEQVGEVPNGV